MKKTTKLITLLSIFIAGFTQAQTVNKGKPIGLRDQIQPNSVIALPQFNQTAERQTLEQMPKTKFIFGKNFEVDYGIHNAGSWTNLPSGDRLWQIHISSDQALSLNLIFDQFYIPSGGYVYLYNPETLEVVGAYTADNNNAAKTLGTELVQGDEIIVEYFEPYGYQNESMLHIGTITHGLRSLRPYAEAMMRDLNDAGDCNIDVNCPLGSGWESQRNAVAMIISGGNALCTGSLVNNTNEDGTPYFLTANHCGNDPTSWVFRFRWESPTPDCATTAPSANGPTNFESNNGAVFRAANAGSDFFLCELNTAPNPAWDIYYAGWDRTDVQPTQQTGIHHPSGDIKKICRNNDPATQTVWQSAECWEIADWDQGVTEGGSSGSPLFDQNHRIIGQLYGGSAACSGTVDNDQPDYYGRFGVSWDGPSSSERLKDWLDPGNTGVNTLDGYNPLTITNNNDVLASSLSGINASYCGSADANPVFTFRNNGLNALTSLIITLQIDGNNQVINWTGNLASGDYDSYDFGNMTLPNGNYTIKVFTTNPNGVADEAPNNDTVSIDVDVKNPGYPVTLEGRVDCQGQEVTMEIVGSGGQTQWTLPANTFSGGTTLGETFSINTCVSTACNDLVINDAGGDGWDDQSGGCFASFLGVSLSILDNQGTEVASLSDPAFGSSETIPFCAYGNVSVEDFDNFKNVIYPNPFNEQVTLETEATDAMITIYDMKGAIIFQAGMNGQNRIQFNTSNWSKGMYILKVQSDALIDTQKIVKQ